jgi:hypothetical protein
MKAAPHKWEFRARFRRHAYGWKSQPAITRIREAVSEIRRVAKKDPALAAEGAVLFLERLSPALERIDSSSGAIGMAVGRALDALVPVIAQAHVDDPVRQQWLERLWQAIMDDEIPYIEQLGDRWGELCGNPGLASIWADEFLPLTRQMFSDRRRPGDFFKGTSVCLSAMLAAARYEEILELFSASRSGVRSLYKVYEARARAAMGRIDDAVSLLATDGELHPAFSDYASVCEEMLLAAGQVERAFHDHGYKANLRTTYLATYRAICKKYPSIDARSVLEHCITQTPSQEGKWFAAARHAGFLDIALELATDYIVEPKTLITATRDHAETDPAFAVHVGLAALRNMDSGFGYEEATPADVHTAYHAVLQAARAADRLSEAVISMHRYFGGVRPDGIVWSVLRRELDFLDNARDKGRPE